MNHGQTGIKDCESAIKWQAGDIMPTHANSFLNKLAHWSGNKKSLIIKKINFIDTSAGET